MNNTKKIKNKTVEIIEKREKSLIDSANEYLEKGEEFQEIEERIKVIKAKVMNMDRVINLPNQSLREAEMDLILQNNEQIAPAYRVYLEKKAASKRAWVMWELNKELMQKARTMLNNLTFGNKEGGDSNDE